jgi:hypothetical protein
MPGKAGFSVKRRLYMLLEGYLDYPHSKKRVMGLNTTKPTRSEGCASDPSRKMNPGCLPKGTNSKCERMHRL